MKNLLCLLGLHKTNENPRMKAMAPWMIQCQRESCKVRPWIKKEFKSPATPEEREALRSYGIPDREIP